MRYLFALLLLVVSGGRTYAQLNNSGILHILSGTTVCSTGDFTNGSGGDYLNNGSLYISGNCTNDQPSLPAGQGTTIFNGSTAQLLGGSAYFRSFSVTLNNAAGLTLSNRLAIGDGTGGVLGFLSGIIHSSSTSNDVYFYPGSSYTGFDATHHVVGYVTKSGGTNFTFPIGDGSHTADLDLSSLSSAADFQVLYTGSAYIDLTTAPPITAAGIFGKEWWDINRVAGGATAKVTLKWNDARKFLDHTAPATLIVGHYTGGAWQSAGGSSSSPAGGSTGIVGPSNTLSSFSPFTFASTTTPLPITLGTFTVTDKGCLAALAWNTQLEENAAGFDIQQSPDAVRYTSVAYVPARGMPSSYHINVAQQSREAYYRIRMVDKDGNSDYSPVDGLQLNCIASPETIQVFPDPQTVGIDVTVQYTSTAARGTAQLQLIDMTGRRVYSAAVQVNTGVNSYTLPTTSLAPGTYNLQVTGDGWKSAHAYLLLRRN